MGYTKTWIWAIIVSVKDSVKELWIVMVKYSASMKTFRTNQRNM